MKKNWLAESVNLSVLEIEAVFAGHSDGARNRLIALLVLRGLIDPRTALRRFEIAPSTLSEAKTTLRHELSRRSAFAKKAVECSQNPQNPNTGKTFPELNATLADIASKMLS